MDSKQKRCFIVPGEAVGPLTAIEAKLQSRSVKHRIWAENADEAKEEIARTFSVIVTKVVPCSEAERDKVR